MGRRGDPARAHNTGDGEEARPRRLSSRHRPDSVAWVTGCQYTGVGTLSRGGADGSAATEKNTASVTEPGPAWAAAGIQRAPTIQAMGKRQGRADSVRVIGRIRAPGSQA